jgi:hypothetical protein
MGSVAASGLPISLLKQTGRFAAGGRATVAVVIKAYARPHMGLVMQVAATYTIVAILLQGSPRSGVPATAPPTTIVTTIGGRDIGKNYRRYPTPTPTKLSLIWEDYMSD